MLANHADIAADWIDARTVDLDSEADRITLIDRLTVELTSNGLDRDGEVNEYGRRLYELISIFVNLSLP